MDPEHLFDPSPIPLSELAKMSVRSTALRFIEDDGDDTGGYAKFQSSY